MSELEDLKRRIAALEQAPVEQSVPQTLGLLPSGLAVVAGGATVQPSLHQQGPLIAGSGVNDVSIGTKAWVNPANVNKSDGVTLATNVASTTQTTNYLRSTTHGFSIPAAAAVQGIQVSFTMEANVHGVLNSLKLAPGGVPGGIDHSDSFNYVPTGTLITRSYGGPSDLWGFTAAQLDPATILNATTFGFAVAMSHASTTDTDSAQNFTITVFYTTTP